VGVYDPSQALNAGRGRCWPLLLCARGAAQAGGRLPQSAGPGNL